MAEKDRRIANTRTHHATARAHGCQMAIALFFNRMCLALWASGLWLRYATLQNLIPSFPWIAPPRPPPRLNPRKGRDQILLSSNLVRAPHEWTYVGRTDISAGIAKSTQTQGHISRKYYVMMRNRKFKEILTIFVVFYLACRVSQVLETKLFYVAS